MSEVKQFPVQHVGGDLQIRSWDELTKRAEFMARSSLIPTSLRGKAADVAIILQMGLELGIPPMQALNGITVIQGKPTVDPQLAVALIRSKVPESVIIFKELTESKAVVTMARARDRLEESYTATWDLEKAKKMDLLGKQNWKMQPGNMLKWRAVMEAARAVFPDVIKGFYSYEEMSSASDRSVDQEKGRNLHAALEPKPEIKDVVSEVVETTTDDDPKPTDEPTPEEIAYISEAFGPPETQKQDEQDPGEFVVGFGRNSGKALRELTDFELQSLKGWIEKTANKPLNEKNKRHLDACQAALTRRGVK